MTEKPPRPHLVTNNEAPVDNPFPPTPPVAGRVVNAMRGAHLSRDVKEAIISGAARYGRDGTGEGGMPGYLEMCAATFPKEYMGLLARLVPIQNRDTASNAAINIGSVNIHPVASDRYLTATEMREMTTPIIDHVPTEPTPETSPPVQPTPAVEEPEDETPPPVTDPPTAA
jgi:hypothetical protein